MTKEELEKATGQELIDERNYCGVDGYYGDYLDNVNTEILKRLNRLADLEKENAELERKLEQTEKDLADYQFNYPTIKELQKENAELKARLKEHESIGNAQFWENVWSWKTKAKQLTKAKEIIREFVEWATWQGSNCPNFKSIQDKAEQFLKDSEGK